MCKFFSIVTEPEQHGGQRFYFDWEYRKAHLSDSNESSADSHSHICLINRLDEDKCNKYEYNPLTKIMMVDQINSGIDDRVQAEEWLNNLDFKKIVDPLIIKEIINPLKLPKVEQVTDEQIQWLKDWASVRASVGAGVWANVWAGVGAGVWANVGASVRASVRDSVMDSVRDSVWASVGASVWDSVRDSVWDSVRDSVGAYISSFFAIQYKFNYTSGVKLWEAGLVPSFDGKTWRLHSGQDAEVVYEWIPEGVS
jgi:hypothetical protein